MVLVPLALFLMALALANRQTVTLSLDPFADEPTLTVRSPLFLIVLAALAVGVIIGGITTWLRQGRWRRAARRAEMLVHTLRAEGETLRRQLEAHERAGDSSREIVSGRPPTA